MADGPSYQVPPILLALCSPGSIRVETAMAVSEALRHCDKMGLQIQVGHFGGALVDKARNDAARTALKGGFGAVLYIDGDMVFGKDAIMRLVQSAYLDAPWADAIGAYCVLRGGAVPTIDTGTGTWESHYPGSGILEVIRTGGAFLLVKMHCLQRFPEPWFACRFPSRWLDAMADLDNLARTLCDGRNPFADLPAWAACLDKARTDPQARTATAGYEIGEDSGFCDRAKFAGLRIAVDTNISIGHLDTVVLDGDTHKRKMDERAKETRLIYGVLV